MGLKQQCTYEAEEERATLRYGHILVMTDQDHDGSHIQGLIYNLFAYYWPALLPMLQKMITPVVSSPQNPDLVLSFTLLR